MTLKLQDAQGRWLSLNGLVASATRMGDRVRLEPVAGRGDDMMIALRDGLDAWWRQHREHIEIGLTSRHEAGVPIAYLRGATYEWSGTFLSSGPRVDPAPSFSPQVAFDPAS